MPATLVSSGRSSPRFGRRARVLCDYDARDPEELSLMSDEVTQSGILLPCVTLKSCCLLSFENKILYLLQIINVRDTGDGNADYYLGERGSQKGKVPRAFLEVLDD